MNNKIFILQKTKQNDLSTGIVTEKKNLQKICKIDYVCCLTYDLQHTVRSGDCCTKCMWINQIFFV